MSLSDHALRRLVPVLLAVLALPSCGFQIRGIGQLPEGMSVVYIAASDRYTPFYRELTAMFLNSGLEVTQDPLQADSVFRVVRDESGQRLLSVSARNVPREYDIYYLVEYSLSMDDREIVPPQQLTLTRDYTWDETQVLGKALEEERLRKALATDIVGLITRRISSVN